MRVNLDKLADILSPGILAVLSGAFPSVVFDPLATIADTPPATGML